MISQKPASPDTFLDRLYAKINGGLDQFGTPSPAEVARIARTARQSWSFELAGGEHTVELKRKWWRSEPGPCLFCDGHQMGTLQMPGGRQGRTEDALTLDGTPVVVALEWRRDWVENLYADVFVAGVSLLDGRTLELARATAPGAISQYDTQMSKLRRSIRQNLVMIFFLPFFLALGAGCAAGLLFGILLGAWELGWFGGTAWVNGRNLARPGLGFFRWPVVVGYFVGYPIISCLLLAAAWAAGHPH